MRLKWRLDVSFFFQKPQNYKKIKYCDGTPLRVKFCLKDNKIHYKGFNNKTQSSFEILNSLKSFNCWPNVFITCRLILIILILVASLKRKFLKLKLLKYYLYLLCHRLD